MIAAKRHTRLSLAYWPLAFWRFRHPVVMATAMSLTLLTGCQTTTGMQNGTPANGQVKSAPARSSTATLPSIPSIPSNPSTPSNPSKTATATAKVLPTSPELATETAPKPPNRDPILAPAQGTVISKNGVATQDNEGDDKALGRSRDIKVAEDYGVLFPSDTARSPTSTAAPAPAVTETNSETNSQTKPLGQSTVDSTVNAGAVAPQSKQHTEQVATDVPNDVDANVDADADARVNHREMAVAEPVKTDNLETATPTAIIIKIPKPDPETVQQTLLNQARQHSTARPNTPAPMATGDDIPAFRQLMNAGVKQLRQGQLSAAQSTFTRAQRLAPQSSAVYFYLAQVALKQNQYLKAEAMARRGLVVAQTAPSKKSLWQVILISAQYQGNQRVIAEAQAALAH